jgi:hypothetical protein
MTQDYKHPITPPPWRVHEWREEAARRQYTGSETDQHIAVEAAQWGADQELEACREWLNNEDRGFWGGKLRAARRPKPPSLKELALAVLENEPEADDMKELIVFDVDQVEIIRRALEQLDD